MNSSLFYMTVATGFYEGALNFVVFQKNYYTIGVGLALAP
jgi:hypothetical protein